MYTCSNLLSFIIIFIKTCTPPDWVYFNNSCFKVFKEKLNWFDAHWSCASNKSTLTSIHGAEENNFLRKTGQASTPSSISSAWIGLFNLNSTDRSYQWVDGSMVDFRNWNVKEPNNAHSGENCTELYVTRNLVCARNWVLNCLAGAAVMIEEQKSRGKKLIISEFFPILFLKDTGRFDH